MHCLDKREIHLHGFSRLSSQNDVSKGRKTPACISSFTAPWGCDKSSVQMFLPGNKKPHLLVMGQEEGGHVLELLAEATTDTSFLLEVGTQTILCLSRFVRK
jgi:hypothetical protein